MIKPKTKFLTANFSGKNFETGAKNALFQTASGGDGGPTTPPNLDKEKLKGLVNQGKIDPDTLVLFSAIDGVSIDWTMEQDKYNKLKELDNKVFSNADLWVGEDKFTIIDKKSGKSFEFQHKLKIGEFSSDHVGNTHAKFAAAGNIVESYLADGEYSEEDRKKLKEVDDILDETTITLGSDKISVVHEKTADSENFDLPPPSAPTGAKAKKGRKK